MLVYTFYFGIICKSIISVYYIYAVNISFTKRRGKRVFILLLLVSHSQNKKSTYQGRPLVSPANSRSQGN